MAMTVEIVMGTGGTPTWTARTTHKWNRTDTYNGTTPTPVPTATGTNFSFCVTYMVNITATGGLTMTDIKFGKVAGEATTGTKLWHRADIAEGSYVEATAATAATSDNNVTAPAIPHSGNNTGVTAVPLIGSASVYEAGPHSTTGRKGDMVQAVLGVDATCVTAGQSVATPTLRFQWTEA